MTPRYAVLTCPVCWNEVNLDDKTITYNFNEYIFTFCSQNCYNKFNEEPNYYIELILSSINHKCHCGGNCCCNE